MGEARRRYNAMQQRGRDVATVKAITLRERLEP